MTELRQTPPLLVEAGRSLLERLLYVMLVFAVLGVLSILAGCHQQRPPAPPTVVVSGCDAFGVITASPQDTAETKRQVLAYAQARKRLCGAAAAKP